MPTLVIVKMAAFVSQTWSTAEQTSCTMTRTTFLNRKGSISFVVDKNINMLFS